jgi:hypothetical protein
MPQLVQQLACGTAQAMQSIGSTGTSACSRSAHRPSLRREHDSLGAVALDQFESGSHDRGRVRRRAARAAVLSSARQPAMRSARRMDELVVQRQRGDRR